MSRRFLIAKGRVGPAWDTVEERARARYLLARQLPGTHWVLTDAALYRRLPHGSAELRAAADAALEAELEASIKEAEKC
jgi:hypothetical protein